MKKLHEVNKVLDRMLELIARDDATPHHTTSRRLSRMLGSMT